MQNIINIIIWSVVAILIVVLFITIPELIEQSHRVNAFLGLAISLISFIGIRINVIVENHFKKTTQIKN